MRSNSNTSTTYADRKRALGLPETQLEKGFCAESFHTVTTYHETAYIDYTVKMKNTAESLGLKSEDYSHLNPRSSKNYAGLGKNGGRKGGGRNKRSFGMKRGWKK